MSAKILRFPRHFSRPRLAPSSKTSTGSSAALMIGSRHLCGTDPRWRHFLSASGVTPSERAACAISSQFTVMEPKARDDLSLSQETTWDELPETVIAKIVPMASKQETRSAFRKGFLERTRQAREARGWSQAQMGKYLGIKGETYKKYETRSLLPHSYIETFCALTGITTDFLYTGQAPQKRVLRRTA